MNLFLILRFRKVFHTQKAMRMNNSINIFFSFEESNVFLEEHANPSPRNQTIGQSGGRPPKHRRQDR